MFEERYPCFDVRASALFGGDLKTVIHRADTWTNAKINLTASDLTFTERRSIVVVEVEFKISVPKVWMMDVILVRGIGNTFKAASDTIIAWHDQNPDYFLDPKRL